MKLKKMLVGLMAGLIGVMTVGCSSTTEPAKAEEKKPEVVTTESGKKEEPKKDNAKEEKVKINVLIHDTDESISIPMKKFMEEYREILPPNIEIEMDLSPGDAQTFETKVRTMISSGGEGLDVWWERGGSWATPILNAQGALPLDERLEQMAFWDTMIPSAKLPSEDGNIYAVPFEEVFFEIILYNKELFAQYNLEVPKTVDALKEVVDVLNDTDIIPIAVGGKDGWPAAMMVEGFAYSVDPQITKKIVEGSAKFSDEPYKASAQVVKELMDMGAFSKNVALTELGEALQLFETGKAGMLCIGSWELPAKAATMGDKVDYFYYPAIREEDGAKVGKNVAGGLKQNAGLMVYSGTEYPDEATLVAVELAKYMNKYRYEEKSNPFVVYDSAKLGWKEQKPFEAAVQKLKEDMVGFEFVYGFVQDVMPTAPATAGVMEYTSKFLANNAKYTVESYLGDLDKARAEE